MRRQYFDYRPRTQFNVRGDRLEQMVWEQVRPLLEDPSRVADEYRRRISQASGEADPPEQVARLDHQITTIQRSIDRRGFETRPYNFSPYNFRTFVGATHGSPSGHNGAC
jgi:hypothetical protein